jgi:phosphoribosylaminoimidazole carboxylase
MDKHVIGVLGGGQLGRMQVEAASRLGIQVAILDSENAPAKQISNHNSHVTGSFATAADVRKLAAKSDVITYEIEHVDTKVLEELEEEQPYINGTKWSRIQPSWRTVRVIQDKFLQKQHYAKHDLPTAKSIAVGTSEPQGLKEIADQLGYPFMLKSRTEAYDGRGNYPVKSVAEIEGALSALKNRPLYAEKWCNFKVELAVMVVKTVQEADIENWEKNTLAYPTVETIHEDSICKLVYAPARNVSQETARAAQVLAQRTVSTFEGTGVFGVEMFLLQDGSLVINEVAPRPHNSGHYSIEACYMSQYEAQTRAVLPRLAHRIPPGSTAMKVNAAIMLNILGGAQPDSHLLLADAALDVVGAQVHLYGKGDGRPGRKMGHITVTGTSMSDCEVKIHSLVLLADAIRDSYKNGSRATAEGIKSKQAELANSQPTPKPQPVIAVCMGSDTDLATLKAGLQILDTMDIPFDVHITSAHRTPQYMIDFGEAAASKGYKAIIAAAGGAAHLPGMMASSTTLPVIGVPVKASAFDGHDSLMSIVQMPRGIPVATVGVGNSTNAAILAARIVGTSDAKAAKWVADHAAQMHKDNMVKEERLQVDGWKGYQRVDDWDPARRQAQK